MSIITSPHILLPQSGTDMSRFSVIACDQFTSQIEYWHQLKNDIGSSPSTYHMIFPEAYLGHVNHEEYIQQINTNIQSYLDHNILQDQGPCFILVERSTPTTPRRLGLVLAIDLEAYTYELGVKSKIRATEATILDRIPPRLKIRANAPVELPHTLLLVDDPNKTVIEALYQEIDQFEKVYDFELNQNGGHIRGYKITDTDRVIEAFNKLSNPNDDSLLFIVGDGNHSLATAKAHWNQIKENLPQRERLHHPARYALVEVENLYDEGLTFEPIHRILFDIEDDFYQGLLPHLEGERDSYLYSNTLGQQIVSMPQSAPEAYQQIQAYIDAYLQSHPHAECDYIHGVDELIEIAKAKNGFAIVMPAMTKQDLFDYIAHDKILAKKSFSMGHANEKRYYLESKKIR